MTRICNSNGLNVQQLADKLTPHLKGDFRHVTYRTMTDGRVAIDMNYTTPPPGELVTECYPCSVTVRIATIPERTGLSVHEVAGLDLPDWAKAKISRQTYKEHANSTFDLIRIAAGVARTDERIQIYEDGLVEAKTLANSRVLQHLRTFNLIKAYNLNTSHKLVKVQATPEHNTDVVRVVLTGLTPEEAKNIVGYMSRSGILNQFPGEQQDV